MHTQKNTLRADSPVRRMLKCYPVRQTCTLECAAGRTEAYIIDLNAGSARLRFADAFAAGLFKYRQRLILNTGVIVGERKLQGISCRMTWKHDTEIGVEFNNLLPCCLADLQASLNRNDAA